MSIKRYSLHVMQIGLSGQQLDFDVRSTVIIVDNIQVTV